jgi:3-deoxy-D-manno-octulosonic-acid transferase
MILFFYNLLLLAVLILGSPWWLFRMATTSKYREGLLQRLGFMRTGVNTTQPIIWIHAVSVGEVLAIGWLVKSLDESLPNFQIIISTTTRTGQQLARERFGINRVFYCPLDLPWAVNRVLCELNPALFILAETEFWPNLLAACSARRIPVAVVNARISDRSWPRYKALRGLWEKFLQPLSLVLAQTEKDAARLRAIGCVVDRVHVSGNLKFDVRVATDSAATQLLRIGAKGRRIVVAGSTLEGEEAALLSIWPALLTEFPNLLLILAPRHPERFSAVAALLDRSYLQWQRRSLWNADPPDENLGSAQIILLDSIGELASVYQLAEVAFVGGSLIPSGGHNPLEPAQFGVPILMGPSYENFRGIVDPMLAAGGIQIVVSDAELQSTLAAWLANTDQARAIGYKAREVFESQSGATARTVEAIRTLLTNVKTVGGNR